MRQRQYHNSTELYVVSTALSLVTCGINWDRNNCQLCLGNISWKMGNDVTLVSSLRFRDAIGRRDYGVNVGSYIALVLSGNKPLPKLLLINIQWDLVGFIAKQFQGKCFNVFILDTSLRITNLRLQLHPPPPPPKANKFNMCNPNCHKSSDFAKWMRVDVNWSYIWTGENP